MKQNFPFALLLMAATSAYSQIGIGTTNPKSTLDIALSNSLTPKNTDGILIPRINNFPLTPPTVAGLLVYLDDTDNNDAQPDGFYFWNQTQTKWNYVTGWNYSGNEATSPSTAAIGAALNGDFLGTKDNADFVLGTQNLERLRITASGNIGIGKINPTKRLEVNANSDYLKFENLATKTISAKTYYMVRDNSNSEVGLSEVENVAGQILRIGLNTAAYDNTERAIRFKDNNDATEMGASNFINTITGSSFTEGGNLATDKDLINLPAGTYKITMKVSYANGSSGLLSLTTTNNLMFRLYVNGVEYSRQYSTFNASGLLGLGIAGDAVKNDCVFSDFVTLTGTTPLYFSTITEGNIPYNINGKVSSSYRSIILVERLR